MDLAQQKNVQLAWLMAQVLYAVLSAPIMTSDGNLEPNAYETLNGAK